MQVCADVHETAPAITIGYENRRVNSEVVDETVLHAHGGASQTSLLTLRGEVKCEVLDEEQVIVPECQAVGMLRLISIVTTPRTVSKPIDTGMTHK